MLIVRRLGWDIYVYGGILGLLWLKSSGNGICGWGCSDVGSCWMVECKWWDWRCCC